MLIKKGCLTNVTQFHEWNSVIFASAKTHRNPRVHIISLLDSFLEKNVSQTKKAVNTFIISFPEVKKYTQVTVKSKKDADIHDTLAPEWFSFSLNV